MMRTTFAVALVCLFPATGFALNPTAEPAVVLSGSAATPALLDINGASLAQLVRLPGIGESRARAIVEHRLRRPFRRPADLMRVRGIGRRLFFRLKPMLRVGPARESRVRNEEKGGAMH